MRVCCRTTGHLCPVRFSMGMSSTAPQVSATNKFGVPYDQFLESRSTYILYPLEVSFM